MAKQLFLALLAIEEKLMARQVINKKATSQPVQGFDPSNSEMTSHTIPEQVPRMGFVLLLLLSPHPASPTLRPMPLAPPTVPYART